MTICSRCHRTLSRQPVFVAGMALGPRCAVAVAGAKPRRTRNTSAPRIADVRQGDLFIEATP